MKTFTLTPDLQITAYASERAAASSGDAFFVCATELDALLNSTGINPVELWNSLPGVTPVNRFMTRQSGVARIWNQLQSLEAVPEPVEETADVAPETARVPREGSKQAQVLELLKRPGGATLDAIMAATDWQKHTVRGFIAGAAQKKLGLKIESFKNEGGFRTYRVVA